MKLPWQAAEFKLDWSSQYLINETEGVNLNILLLHGFQQHAGHMYHQFMDELVLSRQIYANGLWPVPYQKNNTWSLRYSWYYFDVKTQIYHIEMQPACDYLYRLVSNLPDNGKPWAVVGFSQGGYIVPFAAETLQKSGVDIRLAMGINCRWRSEIIEKPFNFDCVQVHGAKDETVDPDRSQKCFQDLKELGQKGEFVMIPDSGHELDDQLVDTIKEQIKKRSQ